MSTTAASKHELIARHAEAFGMSRRAAEEEINRVTDTLRSAVQECPRVRITGFGTFEQVARTGRTGRNPKTGEPVEIPAGRRLRFKPTKGVL